MIGRTQYVMCGCGRRFEPHQLPATCCGKVLVDPDVGAAAVDPAERQFAGWLATLDSPHASAQVREIALKQASRAYLEERMANTRLEAELEQLRTYKRESVRFENSLASLMLERVPAAVPQTSAPRSPPRLQVVRSERCARCGQVVHAFDCPVRLAEHTGGRPEGA